METLTKILKIESPAFKNNDTIPTRFTCNSINPVIQIKNIPRETKTIAIIVEDPDVKSGIFTHWVAWNIPPKDEIDENSIPGKIGINSNGENKYMAPCPPGGTHHYYFRVYALDAELQLSDKTDRMGLLRAMEGHIIDQAELIGIVSK
jgi:Raf kinase inhibitor-like YbhB/YbcL family protein